MMPLFRLCILPVFYRINWQYAHTSECKRLAAPRGRAGSATNTHYDQDVLASNIIWKIIPRFPFNVKIGFVFGSFLV